MKPQSNEAGNEKFFAMALVIPSGLTEDEFKSRVHAALFALNGACRTAGVGIVQGPQLKKFIEAKLSSG